MAVSVQFHPPLGSEPTDSLSSPPYRSRMTTNEIRAERDWCLAVLAGLAQLDQPEAVREMARRLARWERLLGWAVTQS